MKLRKICSLALAFAMVCTMTVGCAKKEEPAPAPAPNTSAPATSEPAAPTEGMPLTSNIKNLSIGGAGTSGTFYIMAAAYADQITKDLGINTVAEVTAGSVENVTLMDDQQIEMGVVQLDVTLDALAGTGKFSAPVPLQVLTPMYPNLVQIFTLKDSDITCFNDLKGKRVSVGSPGSGILATNEIIFQTLGMSMDDIEPQYLSFAETTDAFRNDAVDAVIVNTAAPAAFLTDLETTHEIKAIPLSDEEIAKFTDAFPFYVESVIPAGTYKSVTEDVKTFAVWIALMCREDMPEDVAYNVAKTIFEGYDDLQNVHSSASYGVVENAKYIQGVDYHPGAMKYLEEQGIKLG